MNFDNAPIFTGDNLPEKQEAKTTAVEVESTRAMAETQAAMIMAKRFPRDQFAAYTKIMESCKRPSLAAVAQYAYPRGGTMITGPSIRLAEVLANAWGNIQFGIIELGRSMGSSEVMAYAWDLEVNTRREMRFVVRHERESKKGTYALEGSRDIYELVANQGARRLRACILGIIPSDVVESAIARCEETLKKGGEPLEDRIRKMVLAFAEYGVTVEMLEKRLQHKMEATIIQELVSLGKIYTSLKDGMAKREDFFELQASGPVPQEEPQQEEKKPERHRRTKAEMEASKPNFEELQQSPTVTCPKSKESVLVTFCDSGECPDRHGCPEMGE